MALALLARAQPCIYCLCLAASPALLTVLLCGYSSYDASSTYLSSTTAGVPAVALRSLSAQHAHVLLTALVLVLLLLLLLLWCAFSVTGPPGGLQLPHLRCREGQV
jgi:hypothetical protein